MRNYLAVAVLLCVVVSSRASESNGSSPVALSLPADQAAVSELVGSGLELRSTLSRKADDERSAKIVWKRVRTNVDSRGGKHEFYRQFAQVGTQEAELWGSEIGIHSDPSGEPRAILGRQFLDVVIANQAVVGSHDVGIVARRAVASMPNFREYVPVVHDRTHDVLKLTTNGGSFRYTWSTVVPDDRGVDHHVVFDAETATLLSASPTALLSNCAPSTPLQSVTATVDPVRDDVPNRTGARANVALDRPAEFLREAYSSTAPAVKVYQETNDTAFKCDSSTTWSYSMVPVALDGSVNVYRDVVSGANTWRGSAAGDAIHHVRVTNSALSAMGRNGWNGTGGALTVMLESTYLLLPGSNTDYAYFTMSRSGTAAKQAKLPPGPVLGVARTSSYYNPAANLDQIAHEMGHGVIFTTANFPCPSTTNPVPCELHEGFSDVIAHIVEKKKQVAGSGVEQSSDWLIHEDGGTFGYLNGKYGYARGAFDDAEGHIWDGLQSAVRTPNDFVHKEDEEGVNAPHARGNMLSVVLRLMSEGGKNDICNREPSYEGCTQTPMPGIGFTKASTIMFDALVNYIPSNATWADLPTYVSQSAFDIYNTCSVDPIGGWAPSEQIAVLRAFYAIGYYRNTPATRCP